MRESTPRPEYYRKPGETVVVRDQCGNPFHTIQFKKRNCLRCDVKFQSSGSHNRLCGNCRNQNFNETSPWAIESGTSPAGDNCFKFSETSMIVHEEK